MENLISSFLSGFGKVFSDLFGSPLDFLSGKSCSSVCGTTWDFICYIENFCITHLLKLVVISVLFYLALLFFYLTYKLGIFHCLAWTCCRIVWGCFSTVFSCVEYSCSSICYGLSRVKRVRRRRRRHRRDIENRGSTSEEEMEVRGSSDLDDTRRSFSSRDWKGYKRDRLRKSLQPRNHRIRVGVGVGIGGDSNRRNGRYYPDNDGYVKVSRTSKFAKKGGRRKSRFNSRN